MKTINKMRQELAEKAARDDSFRTAIVADSKAVIKKEYGLDIPGDVTIAVHEDSATTAHLILPPNPMLSESDLSRVAGAAMNSANTTDGTEYGITTKDR